MGYLITQILVCLLIAFLIGLLLGWLLWNRRDDAAPAAVVDEGELDAARQRIRTLEADLADCRAVDTPTFEPPPVATPPPPPPMAAPAAAAVGGAGGVLGFGPPAAQPVDDLKRVKGIGPVIEKQLAGLGIVTFRQIAEFSADDVQRVGDALGVFSDRIGREEWVRQAAALHAEAYGNATDDTTPDAG